jgi:hypothetical protein
MLGFFMIFFVHQLWKFKRASRQEQARTRELYRSLEAQLQHPPARAPPALLSALQLHPRVRSPADLETAVHMFEGTPKSAPQFGSASSKLKDLDWFRSPDLYFVMGSRLVISPCLCSRVGGFGVFAEYDHLPTQLASKGVKEEDWQRWMQVIITFACCLCYRVCIVHIPFSHA